MDDPTDRIRIDRGGWISGPCLDITQETRQLEALHGMWDHRYRVEVIDGVWKATRLGNSLITFTADSAEELRSMIWADFIRWSKKATKHNASPAENPGCSV